MLLFCANFKDGVLTILLAYVLLYDLSAWCVCGGDVSLPYEERNPYYTSNSENYDNPAVHELPQEIINSDGIANLVEDHTNSDAINEDDNVEQVIDLEELSPGDAVESMYDLEGHHKGFVHNFVVNNTKDPTASLEQQMHDAAFPSLVNDEVPAAPQPGVGGSSAGRGSTSRNGGVASALQSTQGDGSASIRVAGQEGFPYTGVITSLLTFMVLILGVMLFVWVFAKKKSACILERYEPRTMYNPLQMEDGELPKATVVQ